MSLNEEERQAVAVDFFRWTHKYLFFSQSWKNWS